MRIVRIFDGKLYAFIQKGQRLNELERLLRLWRDASYVLSFLKANEADLPTGKSVLQLAKLIAGNANTINDILINESENLNKFFRPLVNTQPLGRVLMELKGREQYLRLYALKVAENCFVITGGAIKFTRFMQERTHTNDELIKLNRCRDYLNSNGVFDTDSFFELINERL